LSTLSSLAAFFFYCSVDPRHPHSFPRRRSSDLPALQDQIVTLLEALAVVDGIRVRPPLLDADPAHEAGEHAAARDQIGHRELLRSEEHTSELQSLRHLVCRLLLEKKKKNNNITT